MIFDYSTKGKVQVDMTKYMKKMVTDFEKKYVLNNMASTPASNDLFGNDEKSPKLDDEMREDFHTFVAKGLFACKCARPVELPANRALTCHYRMTDRHHWQTMSRRTHSW